jgi:hypothetical protein
MRFILAVMVTTASMADCVLLLAGNPLLAGSAIVSGNAIMAAMYLRRRQTTSRKQLAPGPVRTGPVHHHFVGHLVNDISNSCV